MKMLHIFTEEPSIKIVFDIILPKILPEGDHFQVYPHQGKQDLEKALSKTVPTISRIPGSRILITRDQDSGDCKEIKQHLQGIAELNCQCAFAVRIVCRELEAWYLGDMNAIEEAFPRFRAAGHQHKSDYRNVDTLQSPNKTLLRIIPEYANKDYLPKLETAEKIAPFLNVNNNSSESFKQTIKAILKMVS